MCLGELNRKDYIKTEINVSFSFEIQFEQKTVQNHVNSSP